MHVTISTRNVHLDPRAQKHLDRKISHLKKRLKPLNPDLIEITLVVEKLKNKSEFRTTLNCRLPMRTLRAEGVEGNEVGSMSGTFEVMERQLDKFLAHLRHEDERGR